VRTLRNDLRGDRFVILRNPALAILATVMFLSACGTDDTRITESVAGTTPEPDASAVARDTAVAAIYATAAKKDEKQLLDEQSHRPGDPAIALALYTIDASKYAGVFVADYPQKADALENDYGSRLTRANLEPAGARFPIDALEQLAAGGNAAAATRLFAALANAGPTTAPLYRSAALALVRAKPDLVLPSIDVLSAPDRVAAIGDPMWCAKGATNLPIPAPTPAPSVTAPATALPTSTPDGTAIATLAGITDVRDRSCVVAAAPSKRKKAKRHGGNGKGSSKGGRAAKATSHPSHA
jgi:hypothetical protein